ncbi:MAG: hypothetical protein ACREP3_12090 [Candidatus Binatia bacterium]
MSRNRIFGLPTSLRSFPQRRGQDRRAGNFRFGLVPQFIGVVVIAGRTGGELREH